jgi:hypothetical protein
VSLLVQSVLSNSDYSIVKFEQIAIVLRYANQYEVLSNGGAIALALLSSRFEHTFVIPRLTALSVV